MERETEWSLATEDRKQKPRQFVQVTVSPHRKSAGWTRRSIFRADERLAANRYFKELGRKHWSLGLGQLQWHTSEVPEKRNQGRLISDSFGKFKEEQ